MARHKRGSTRKLLINAVEPEESRIAILQGGKLDEYYIERQSLGSTLGNIYKAKITNVEKSIGAAFVDFGHQRQGFLHVSDLCMEAVGDEARELLAGVQAAREVAHDEDVVAPPKPKPAAEEAAVDATVDVTGDGESAASDDGGLADTDPGSAEVGPDELVGPVPEPPVELTITVGGESRTIVAPAEPETKPEPETGTADEELPELELEELDDEDAPAASEDQQDEDAEGEDVDDDDDESLGYSPDLRLDSGRGESLAELEDDEDDDGEHGDDEAVPPQAVDLDDDDDEDDEEEDEDADVEAPEGLDDSDPDGDASVSETDDQEQKGEAGAATEDGSGDGDESSSGRRGRRRGRRGGRGRTRRRDGQGGSQDEAGGSSSSEDGAQPAHDAGEAESETDSDTVSDSVSDPASDSESDSPRRRGRRGGRGRKQRDGRQTRAPRRRDQRQMPAIEQVLHKGQEIVVQVIKDGIGTKGPTLTTFLSIPGRFIVLMPGIQKRGVSRKVANNAERDRLKGLVRELAAPECLGFIVRTAGSGCSREDLQRDLDYLIRVWERMQSRTEQHRAPVLLYQENDLVIRTLRDLYDGQGDIVIDEEETANKAREFVGQILPECVDKVQTYDGEKPLFSHYGLESELSRLLQSRLELKSGASLVIEQTEALVAVDVNSGRFKPEVHGDIDLTAFTVNCEAAVEVARQLRLRDLGGVVVIDFIDMRQEKHRKKLERLFKEELRKDRARIKVARFSPFGILELTRQRVRPSLKRTVHQKCPYCESTGFIPSDETSCLNVIRTVRENIWRPGALLVVTVRPEVAEAVLNTQKKAMLELEKRSGKEIFVRADHRLAYEDIEVRAMITMPDSVDHRRA